MTAVTAEQLAEWKRLAEKAAAASGDGPPGTWSDRIDVGADFLIAARVAVPEEPA